MFQGSRLKQRRMELRISQEILAEELNVHVNTIRRWEQGKQAPDANKLDKLASSLSTSVAYLSGETENPEREKNDRERLPYPLKDSLVSRSIAASLLREDDFIGNIKGGYMLFYERNGESFMLPATEEGFNFLRDLTIDNDKGKDKDKDKNKDKDEPTKDNED